MPNPKLTDCSQPGKRLFYRNEFGNVPTFNVCVNKRDNDIPQYAIDANKSAHRTINAYLQQNGIPSTPWLYYKLINVQYYPYDKNITVPTPNGSLYGAQPPYTAKNPARSSFYMANIVVGAKSRAPAFQRRAHALYHHRLERGPLRHKNTYYAGNFYNAGGCLGCHGSQGQNPGRAKSEYEPNPPGSLQAGDFSVILARGHVDGPETTKPAAAAAAAEAVGDGLPPHRQQYISGIVAWNSFRSRSITSAKLSARVAWKHSKVMIESSVQSHHRRDTNGKRCTKFLRYCKSYEPIGSIGRWEHQPCTPSSVLETPGIDRDKFVALTTAIWPVGGFDGPLVVPGAPMQSNFYLALAGLSPFDDSRFHQMPDINRDGNARTATDAELAMVETWIRNNAPA